MKRKIAAVLLVVSLLGCAKKVPDKFTYTAGLPAGLTTTPVEGMYALYREGDDRALATYVLRAGEPIGFEPGESGKVVAVAGKTRLPLSGGKLSWVRR